MAIDASRQIHDLLATTHCWTGSRAPTVRLLIYCVLMQNGCILWYIHIATNQQLLFYLAIRRCPHPDSHLNVIPNLVSLLLVLLRLD